MRTLNGHYKYIQDLQQKLYIISKHVFLKKNKIILKRNSRTEIYNFWGKKTQNRLSRSFGIAKEYASELKKSEEIKTETHKGKEDRRKCPVNFKTTSRSLTYK